MFPTLDVAGYPVSLYFAAIALGYTMAVWLFVSEARRTGVDADDTLDLAIWMIIWGVIGARVLHVLVDGFLLDYVNLCVDPMLVEGRDLIGRPLSDLESVAARRGLPLEEVARLCTESAQCEAAGWGYKDDVAAYEAALASGELSSCFAEPAGYDVGPVCNGESGLCHPERDCLRWAKFWAGGLTFYGGFLAAGLMTVVFATRRRMGMLWAPAMGDLPRQGALANVPVLGAAAHFVAYLRKFPDAILRLGDMAAAPLVFAHALGRLGCYFAGCCFGAVTQGALGVQFPVGSQAYRLHREEHLEALKAQFGVLGEWLSLPVHPTQLYEVGANLLIFGVLYFVLRARKTFHGYLLGWMLVLYGLARFHIEFLRADMRGELLGLATSQWIAVPLVLIGVAVLVYGSRRSGGAVIDDGAWPPLGKALDESVYQGRVVSWGGVEVSPVAGWPDQIKGVSPGEGLDSGAREVVEGDGGAGPSGADEGEEE